MTTTVSKQQLFQYLAQGGASNFIGYQEAVDGMEPHVLDEATFDALKQCDFKDIVTGQNMSENHIGGDELVSAVDGALAAIKDGYTVATWYGSDAEVLIVGYKPKQLTVTDDGELTADEKAAGG